MTGIAYAAAPAASATGAESFLSSPIVPLVLIFGVFYFMLIRPQQKQAKLHQKFLGDLKKGHKIITKGGIYGTITKLTDTTINLEIAKDTCIKVTRSSISGPVTKEGAAAPKKAGG